MAAGHLAAARDEQLADTVRAIASALRAGLSVPQSLAYAAGEAAPPLDASLRDVVDALDVGVPSDEALDRWADAVGTDDARLVAGVLHLHRRSGGDLPVVLDQVAETLRDRRAATREVRALTAQARLSGAILGVLPIGFFGFLWLTSRQEIEGALATPAGLGAVLLGLTLEGLAFLWIRKLLEVRW
jgi:tight adherence protein B